MSLIRKSSKLNKNPKLYDIIYILNAKISKSDKNSKYDILYLKIKDVDIGKIFNNHDIPK